MIELADTLPDINVHPAEYKRLLGFPRDYALEGLPRERADSARAWYAKHGKPWIYAREAESLEIVNGSICIDGVAFSSNRLRQTLLDARANSAVLVAVSAGPELEAESAKAWRDGRPDEYFFLEVFGSAVVEHLIMTIGARLCAWAEAHGLAALPHYSPGYPEWDVAQQPRLLELIRRTRNGQLPGPLEVLESGMPRPKKSLLAVFGLTPHVERVRKLTDLVPCSNCSLTNCQYRRAPYARAAAVAEITAATGRAEEDLPADLESASPTPLDERAKYLTHLRALSRWSTDRLSLVTHDDGSIDATFRYEGTTCSNTGRSLKFVYRVKLGPRDEGYPIREQHCDPELGDDGYRYMCRYMNNAEHLMVAIDQEKPLQGQRLNDVLTWQRPAIGAGCYCEPSSRKHKWGLVLETIHYALVEQEKQRAAAEGLTPAVAAATITS